MGYEITDNIYLTTLAELRLTRSRYRAAVLLAKSNSLRNAANKLDREGPWSSLYHELKPNKATDTPFVSNVKVNNTFTYNLEETTKAYLDVLIPDDKPETDTDYHREVRLQSLLTVYTPVSDLPTLKELVTIINQLPTKKASGEDKISNFMIKQACRAAGSSLLAVFNRCIYEGVFPKIWRTGNIKLILKPNKPPDDPKSYRPITLLPNLGKLLERLIVNRLIPGGITFHNQQYGFTAGRSTVDAAILVRKTVDLSDAKNRIERTSSKRWRGNLRRLLAASVYNLSCFTHGCSTGWVSGVLGNEALTGGAWLAALPCLIALPAAPMFAILADARGRKAGALCICLSFIISWSLAAWCGARGVWAARVAAGAGGAGALALSPLYCAEIAPKARGLAAMPSLACSCGILFAYSAGGMLSAHALSLSMNVPPLILLLSLVWLPETPSFLIRVGKIQEAAKVMCWFNGSDFREDLTDVIEQQEVRIRISEGYGSKDVTRRRDSDTFQPMLKISSGLESNSEREQKQQPACKRLFCERTSRRALISCCVVLCTAVGSGAAAVNSFAAAVLRYSLHQVPILNITAYNFTIYNGTAPRSLFETSEAGSMLCGTALVLGAAVATITVDKVGRKTLLLLSCSGIACGLAVLGVYCDPNLNIQSWYSRRLWHLKNINNKEISNRNKLEIYGNSTLLNITMDNDTVKPWQRVGVENMTEENYSHVKFEQSQEEVAIWLPVLLLSIVLFLYNVGLGSVPFVLVSELFSINVRSFASSFLISWMWLSNFLLLRYFGSMAFSLGLHATYYICASITLLGAGYIYIVIPETKGKSQDQINEALEGPWILMKGKKKNQR